MKNLKHQILLTATVLFFALASCHKDKKITPAPPAPGIFVLNQGTFNNNNSTLSFYNFNTQQVTSDIFTAANGTGLGDTGNDIEIYGAKMYIVVNVSSTIEVVDPKTSKLIKEVKMFNGVVAREPRDIVFYKGSAYITSYDGTVAVMDTTALTISKYITVGRNPEQLTVANGKLYVANSGGLGYPNFDNTVSVIDLGTLTVTKTLTVVANPQNVGTDGNGNVYVLSAGNYNDVPSSLAVIDDAQDVVKSQTNFDGSGMLVQGANAYFITSANKIIVYNTATQTVTNAGFITDGTTITNPYSIAANSTTGEVFVTDAKDFKSNGTLFAFDKTGKKDYSVTVGINPGKVALYGN